MRIQTVHDLMVALRQGSYTSVGGYPLFYLTADGGILSPKSVRENLWVIARAVRDGFEKHWVVVAVDVNWEDPALYDDHSGERIETAYE